MEDEKEEMRMEKPVLVIMAAGMGSRYGGLKQIDPVDGEGHIIMDFSLYDAMEAGFEKVVFVIKKENEKDFKDAVGNRVQNTCRWNTRSRILRIFRRDTGYRKEG